MTFRNVSGELLIIISQFELIMLQMAKQPGKWSNPVNARYKAVTKCAYSLRWPESFAYILSVYFDLFSACFCCTRLCRKEINTAATDVVSVSACAKWTDAINGARNKNRTHYTWAWADVWDIRGKFTSSSFIGWRSPSTDIAIRHGVGVESLSHRSSKR